MTILHRLTYICKQRGLTYLCFSYINSFEILTKTKGGKFHVYPSKTSKLRISSSKVWNYIFLPLNFKNSQITHFIVLYIKTHSKFLKYPFCKDLKAILIFWSASTALRSVHVASVCVHFASRFVLILRAQI